MKPPDFANAEQAGCPRRVEAHRLQARRLRALVWLSGGRVRWRTIQLVLEAGYTEVYRRLHANDPGLTFPTWAPHVRLDYLFAAQGAAGRVTSCEVINTADAAAAPDHFPLPSIIEG